MSFDFSLIDSVRQHPWESYAKSLHDEWLTCVEEGKDMAPWQALFQAVIALEDGSIKEELADLLYKIVRQAPMRKDWPYEEPDELAAIRALRPQTPALPAQTPDARQLADRIRGAWMGRVIGCLLGKPVEGYGSALIGRLCRANGNDPITRYFTKGDVERLSQEDQTRVNHPWSAWREALEEALPSDDDINYPVLNAFYVLKRHGRDFTPDDVAEAWMDSQPKIAYCTAERRAFRNFLIGIRPPLSAIYKNPDRELIGAQIRTDYYGWINPGDPETAADMAWRDGRISHVKNGLYGGMWMAAMLAAAAVCKSIPDVIRAGLGQIPQNCRLAQAVRACMARYENGEASETTLKEIYEQYDESNPHDWVHTLPNAMIVTMALLYGEGDFTRSIGLAVQAGYDTDCNGASVGSIIGYMHGAGCIDDHWSSPLASGIHTQIPGCECVSIDTLVDLTLKHMK